MMGGLGTDSLREKFRGHEHHAVAVSQGNEWVESSERSCWCW